MTMKELKLIVLQWPGKTSNQNGQSGEDCGALWKKTFEAEDIAARIPKKATDAVYAVY